MLFLRNLKKFTYNEVDYLYVLDYGNVDIYKIQGHKLKSVGAVGAIWEGFCPEGGCPNNGWRAYTWIDYNKDKIQIITGNIKIE